MFQVRVGWTAWTAAALIACAGQGVCLAQQSEKPAASAPASEGTSKYVRVVDDDERGTITLQVSTRTFEKEGGPRVVLVGVTHIGDKAYYEALQTYLDAQELVLFEGVKPVEAGDAEDADDASRVKMTKSRMRLLAVLAERHKTEHKAYPNSIDEVVADLSGAAKRVIASSMNDGWGRPLAYSVEAGGRIEIVSLGADGAAGGIDAAADLKFSEQPALTRREKSGGGGKGVQVRMADALGLEFQLGAMDYDRPTWRNSDMTAGELEQRLSDGGQSATALLSMLDGSSLSARLVGLVLGFIQMNPALGATTKVMMVEMLAQADELMGVQAGDNTAGLGKLMKVLLIDRNQVVMDDLRRVIEKEPEFKSVALFYGAGHLADMEKRLNEDFGYSFRDEQWFDAITIDLSKVPGGKAQAMQLRNMMKQTIEQQKMAAATATAKAGKQGGKKVEKKGEGDTTDSEEK